MSLARFSSASFAVASGVAVAAGAAVEVRRESDSGLASLFSDRAGAVAISNPMTADAEGRFDFCVAASPGGFSIEVTSGAESFTLRNVPIGLGQEFDIVESWRASLSAAISATIASLLGAADAAAAFLIVKQDATTDATGVVELATQAEANAGTAGKVATTDLNKLALGTPVATTSGTSHDFTGIPSGTRRITVSLAGVSTNGSSSLQIQLGDAGGMETTGYSSSASRITTAVSSQNSTTGLVIGTSDASDSVRHGSAVLTLLDASTNTWSINGCMGHSNTAHTEYCGGSKSLSAELTQIRLTTVNGTDAFDAGSVNIIYER